ncbi:Arc family DNA-binding protein [Pseudomonas sp. NPDC087358]|uniref:Arc family DNA-binding protein n=1 Tax=Pseudomonas sp. NPDC087358 TaxID=3364439 RepID=UPI00384D4CA1
MNFGKNSREADKFVVRLPEGMRDEIAAAAHALDTSMNTIFIQSIRERLDNQQRQKLLLDALAFAVKAKT